MTIGKVQVIRPPDTTLSVNIDSSLLGIGYIDIPMSQIWTCTPGTAGTLQPLGLSDGGDIGYYRGVTIGWTTLDWLATKQSAPALADTYWQSNIRLPGDYVSGIDITVYLSGTYIQITNANDANPHNVDLLAYRGRTIAQQANEGFGISPTEDGSDWTWNTDLCLTAAQPVPFKTNAGGLAAGPGSNACTQLSFIIDGDHVNYPLVANSEIQLQFHSQLDAGASLQTCRQFFRNFFVTYTRKIN